MIKEEQKAINKKVQDVYKEMQFCIDTFGIESSQKLLSCKAEILKTNGYTILRSYNTIIACIGDNDNICYDFLRMVYGYTATSNQHIAKFRKQLNPIYTLVYRPL